jgi:hypothetical protein
MAASTNVSPSMAEPKPADADLLIALAEKVKFVDIGRRLPKDAGDQPGVSVPVHPGGDLPDRCCGPTIAAQNTLF